MQIKKPQKIIRKKVVAIALIATLLVVAGIGLYFAFLKTGSESDKNNSDASVNYSEATSDQKNAGEQTKENSINPNDPSKTSSSGSDKAASPIPQDNGKSKVSATMTTANQNGSTLRLRFDIGAVINTGTCTLTLKKGSATVTKTAGVQALAGSSTCRGFDIPTNELSVGTWQVALHFENNDLIADGTGVAGVQ